MEVPFLDLKAQYKAISSHIDKAISDVIEDTAFVRGLFVSNFERAFAAAHSGCHCVGVGNGTDALFVVYHVLGLGQGDEVITTACSWIATSETITLAGAKPIFVDVDADYFHINPQLIEAKITEHTRAIVPVHLYGQPVDIEAIRSICKKHKLLLIEDCAQAHFAEYRGCRVGTFGEAATFSFYPGKNLGAYGDAGCILSSSQAISEQFRRFANHGSLSKHDHEVEGINSRLDGLQAAILSAKLPYLESWNVRRCELASRYTKKLADVDEVITPKIRPDVKHVFHIYCLRASKRDQLGEWLKARGIQTLLHYPKALPFLKAYKRFGANETDFPVAYKLQQEIISLPIYPEMTDEAVDYVSDCIKEFYS
jgi:dTDP-4-amino-4,6-dideoxygalactose transaminase